MIRRSITRACLVSLLTLGPASQGFALQLNSVGAANWSAANRTASESPLALGRSILEPIAAKQAPQRELTPHQQVQNVRQPANVSTSISAATRVSTFAQLDSIVAAKLQDNAANAAAKEAGAENAVYESAVSGYRSRQIEQASAQLPTGTVVETQSSEAAIMIHPPRTRSTTPNRHYFEIENTSRQAAKNVVVELVVPNDNHIVEVAPYETVVVGKTARYKFASIPAGESRTIQLTTSPRVKHEVVFESRFSMEHVRHLATRSAPHKVEVWSPEKDTEPTPPAKAEKLKQKVQAQTIATKPESNVLSRNSARQPSEQPEQLNYGAVEVPAQVAVSKSQPVIPREPVAQPLDQQLEREASSIIDRYDTQLETPQSNTRQQQAAELTPQVDSDDLPLDAAAPSSQPDGGWFQSQLKTKIDGPQHAVTGEEAEYQVLIENASADDVSDVLVQLAIPTGLEVTVLDRDAWFDGEARTITWKLPNVSAGSKETIRYLAKVISADGQLQTVTLGAANQFRGQAIFQSTVMDKYELAAPLLPFERDRNSLK